MGRTTKNAFAVNVSNIPAIGGISDITRSGTDYKATGEIVSRAAFSALSALFPQAGAFAAETYGSTSDLSDGSPGLPFSDAVQSIAYGNGVHVATTGLSNGAVSVSTDGGKTWIVRETGAGASATTIGAITFGNGKFVGVPTSGGTVTVVSTDGINWTLGTISAGNYRGVTYGAGVYCAVGASACATSTDGLTWTNRTMPSSSTWYDVAFNGSLFLAVAAGSTNAATSADGITWTARTKTGSSSAPRLFVGASSKFFLCDTSLYSTTDGITWTTQKIPASYAGSVLNVVCGAYGNGVHVVLTSSGNVGGNGNMVLTSTDGTNWTGKSIGNSINTAASRYAASAIAYGAGWFVFNDTRTSNIRIVNRVFAENATDSDLMYLAGPAGKFVRVK